MPNLLPFLMFAAILQPIPEPAKLTPAPKLVGLYAACAAADLVSTEVFLSRGVRELNPMMQTRGRRLAVKSLTTVGLVLIDREIEKRGGKKTAKWWRVGVVAAHVFLVTRNLRAGR